MTVETTSNVEMTFQPKSNISIDTIARLLRATVFSSWFGLALALAANTCSVSINQVWARRLVYYSVFRAVLAVRRRLIRRRCGGVGNVLTKELANLGAKVAVIDIRVMPNDQQNVMVYECDITNREQLSVTAQQIREQMGNPTVLINNAGWVSKGSILNVSPENIEKTFQVNNLAHFWTVREFLPAMQGRKQGHIVTIASIAGWSGLGGLTSYAASKGAAVMFHDSLQHELHMLNSGVHTTMVCPGHIATNMFADFGHCGQFVMPILSPTQVVKPIIEAIAMQKDNDVYLPLCSNILPYVWLLSPAGRRLFKFICNYRELIINYLKK
ncbi:hypothetical protein BDF19DRAFT_431062 [Syncephalis fuscata]|nr:hypothetical protein BDF19DRAFT_431062 [Syncephalis fuscata]